MSRDYRMDFIRSLEERLAPVMDPMQVHLAVDAATKVLADYEIMERCTELALPDDRNEKIIKRYCACLSIDGKSEKTIYQYRRTITKLSDFIQKPFTEMGAYDIRFFLACEKERGLSNRSLENTRANISALFQWLTVEDIIPKNPVAAINNIKFTKEVRKPFSDTEIDALRSSCRTLKDRALMEVLLSSGIRVSELSSMDRGDVNMTDLSVIVRHGKGNKERSTYITAVAAMHLKRYLDSRKDTGSCLFCNRSKNRLEPGGIRHILGELSKRSGVENVHSHRFRRTFATNLAARGMEIQEIQKLLGHENINTTLEYVCISDDRVRASYQKYIA